jgi:hypothetical protein
LAAHTFRLAWASQSGRSSASAGDGMDGASAGASMAESSSVAVLMPFVAERSITTQRLCTETIEDSLPVVQSERAGSVQPQVADTRAHLEATRELRTASLAIAEQPLTGAPWATEDTQAAGDTPVPAAAVSRVAVRTVADTLVADTAALPVTVAADTAAGAKDSV